MARIHPRGWEQGVMPLSTLPQAHQDRIAREVAQDEPPARWSEIPGLALVESRAWYEWHWARGRMWRNEDGTTDRPTIPRRVRAAVIERDGLVCGLCSDPVDPTDIHIDHIYPYSLGGGDDLENLQVTHSLCNIRKGARV